MKLEEQVVSLELSKQLKEAEYKQEGLWWWTRLDDSREFILLSVVNSCAPRIHEGIVAPTVAELGEALKPCHMTWKDPNNIWHSMGLEADTEANARAKMWLYLKKEGLLGKEKI